MSVRSNWSVVLFKSSVSFLVSCLVIIPIMENRVLKSPTIFIEVSISPFNSANVCFIHFGALIFGTCLECVYYWLIAHFINL